MVEQAEIIVVGAGVLGLCVAVELALRVHQVTVIDPGGENASSVAAGMIAPAMESVLESVSPARARLLRDARELWPAFAEAIGVELIREGAEWRGADAAEVAARLEVLGFTAQFESGRVRTHDDWRLDVAATMGSLASFPGLTLIRGRAASARPGGGRWRVALDDGQSLECSHLVLASGADRALAGLPRQTAALINSIQPIRGQAAIVVGARAERVVRGPGAYVVPVAAGVYIGATMETGLRDLPWDGATAEPMLAAGAALMELTDHPSVIPRIGVRGASADGLPIGGWSGEPGLYLALAPRRNGWLLGPLVAQSVADGIEGRRRGKHAAALDPHRFL